MGDWAFKVSDPRAWNSHPEYQEPEYQEPFSAFIKQLKMPCDVTPGTGI